MHCFLKELVRERKNWKSNRSLGRAWRGGRRGVRGCLGVACFFAAATFAKPADACSIFNPICWVETAIDQFRDILGHVSDLVGDVLTLDPEGLFDDVIDVIEDAFCDGISPLSIAGGNIGESMFNNCDAPHGIEPDVLVKLETYFNSSFDEVRIYENCDFTNRTAITFGESIYFKVGKYFPLCSSASPGACECRDGMDNVGFALLAHELTHVLQYRREGFADFCCEYTLECGLGAEIAGEQGVTCGFEQQAYVLEAMVEEDMKRDGDGIYTCPLGECDDGIHEWNPGNVSSHSCVAEIQLCGLLTGDPSAPDYCAYTDNCPDTFNPDQTDSDGDGRGDACDTCASVYLPYEDLDDDCVLDTIDNCRCDDQTVNMLSDCDPTNDMIFTIPPGQCFGLTGCAAFTNPDQADFDGDGMGDACDLDDDNDALDDIVEDGLGTNPLDPDSDDDGLTDGEEVLTEGTDPLDSDTDDDALSDGDEVNTFGTDPLDADTDDDGLQDGVEIANGTDPRNPDSDGDGILDGEDVEFLQNAIADLTTDVFNGGGQQNAMMRRLDGIEHRIAQGHVQQALIQLNNLGERVNGCGIAPDPNDWIVDCSTQIQVRMLLDLLIANLSA